MEKMNRQFKINVDINTGDINFTKMSMHNTDKNIFNLSVKLFAKKEMIPQEELSNYALTFIAILPKTKKYVEKEAVLNKDEFEIELNELFTGEVGTYPFEFKVQNSNKVMTTFPGCYKVEGSLITNLNSTIENDPDYEILKELIDEVKGFNLPTKISDLENDMDFITTSEVDQKLADLDFSGVDLTDYAKNTDIPTKSSQ